MSELHANTKAAKFRVALGAGIILEMEKNEDLPVANIHRLGKTMQEYFREMGLQDDVREEGYKWTPTKDYWILKMKDIRDHLAKEKKKYFIFVHSEGGKGFEGLWKFATKEEYDKQMRREHKETGTRIENHNEKLTDGQKRWKIDLPLLDKVPKLN